MKTKSQQNLKKHAERPFSCQFCGKSLKLSSHLKCHKTQFFPCQFCDKKFTSNVTLKSHELGHKIDEKYQKIFENLNLRRNKKHKETSKKVKVVQTKKSQNTKKNGENVSILLKKYGIKPSFILIEKLNRLDIQENYYGLKNSFEILAHFQKHKIVPKKENKKRKSQKVKEYLDDSMLMKEFGIKPCTLRLKKLDNLKVCKNEKQENSEGEIKNIQSCKICNKTFSRRDRLERHEKIHTKNKKSESLENAENYINHKNISKDLKTAEKNGPKKCKISKIMENQDDSILMKQYGIKPFNIPLKKLGHSDITKNKRKSEIYSAESKNKRLTIKEILQTKEQKMEGSNKTLDAPTNDFGNKHESISLFFYESD